MSPRHGPNPSPSTSRDKLEVLSEYERLDKAWQGCPAAPGGPVHVGDQREA
jgi:hypothetical protein